MKPSYYNEFDPFAAQWLRNLIDKKRIPAGDVDERSIVDVQPDDLEGYAQCHFFAGIGGWALAARLAGWPDDRELWTGSCPCQPFSVAGQQKGQDDKRHLWPDFFRLIAARRPVVVMGEQVAAAIGKAWLDGVFADLEGIDYASRAAVLPACAVNAPHRRDRLWFVSTHTHTKPDVGALGYSVRAGLEGHSRHGEIARRRQESSRSTAATDRSGAMGNADLEWLDDSIDASDAERSGADSLAREMDIGNANRIAMADDSRERSATGLSGSQPGQEGGAGVFDDDCGEEHSHAARDTGAWVIGHDGKARRVEPSIQLLADGVPSRVGRLRAYGNAIDPILATEVIAAYLDCVP